MKQIRFSEMSSSSLIQFCSHPMVSVQSNWLYNRILSVFYTLMKADGDQGLSRSKNRTKHHKSFTEVLVQYKSSVLKSFNTFVSGTDWKLRKSHLTSMVTIHFKWLEKKLRNLVWNSSYHEQIKSREVNK